MLQVGIETCLTLHLTGISLLSHFDKLCQLRNTTHYVSTFISLLFPLLDTRVLNLLKELCITWVAAVSSFAGVLNPRERNISCHPQTVSLYHNSSLRLDMLDTSSWEHGCLSVTTDFLPSLHCNY